MLDKAKRFWKAGAAFVGGALGIWAYVAADKAISFEEVGYLGIAIPALIAAFFTAIAPKNKTEGTSIDG